MLSDAAAFKCSDKDQPLTPVTRKLDDFLGEHRDDKIVSIRKSQRRTRHLERDFSLPTISITSLVRIRHQSVDVPPDDLIAWASFLFEISASEQHDLAAMAVQ